MLDTLNCKPTSICDDTPYPVVQQISYKDKRNVKDAGKIKRGTIVLPYEMNWPKGWPDALILWKDELVYLRKRRQNWAKTSWFHMVANIIKATKFK